MKQTASIAALHILLLGCLLCNCSGDGATNSPPYHGGDKDTSDGDLPDPDGDEAIDGDKSPDGDGMSDGDKPPDGDEPVDGDGEPDGDDPTDGDISDGDEDDGEGEADSEEEQMPGRCADYLTPRPLPADGAVNCDFWRADLNYELCEDGPDHCEIYSTGYGHGCEASCAAAGMECMIAYQQGETPCSKVEMTACGESTNNDLCWCVPPFEIPRAYCNSGAVAMFDPYHYRAMSPFPSNFYTRVDEESFTCIRPHFPIERVPPFEADFTFLPNTKWQLEELDGFGTSAKIAFEFNTKLANGLLDPVAPGRIEPEDTTQADAPVLLINIDPKAGRKYGQAHPVLVTYFPEAGSNRSLLLLHPATPLLPGSKYAAIVTNRLQSDDGRCLGPHLNTARLLEGQGFGPGFERIQGEIEPLFDLLARESFQITKQNTVGLTIFSTMDPKRDMLHMAKETLEMLDMNPPTIIEDSLEWIPHYGGQLAWEILGRFESITYRDPATGYINIGADGLPEPVGSHEIQFRLLLPETPGPDQGGEPYKAFVYHHGLGGSNDEGGGVAERLAGDAGGTPRGWATGYISTIHHGERCTINPVCGNDCTPCGNDLLADGLGILHFFAMGDDLELVNVARIAANFRQDYVDWLVFIRLMTHPDGLDVLPPGGDRGPGPDGTPDILDDKVGYTGLSLGGVMGGGIIALSPDIEIAFNNVGGGGVLDIILSGALFGAPIGIISQVVFALEGSPSYELNRWFPFLQTIMDPGDPLNFAEGMFDKPFTELGGEAKPVVFQMVFLDTTVPPITNESLGRAADTVQIGDPYSRVPALPGVLDFPVAGNRSGGITTGYNQFYHNCQADGSNDGIFLHGDMINKPVAVRQWRHFFESFYQTGIAEIVDPYAAPYDCRGF